MLFVSIFRLEATILPLLQLKFGASFVLGLVDELLLSQVFFFLVLLVIFDPSRTRSQESTGPLADHVASEGFVVSLS